MTNLIQSQRNTLQLRLNEIDLAAMTRAIETAESEHEHYLAVNRSRMQLPDVSLEATRLAGVVAHLVHERLGAERDCGRLLLDAQRLDAMLNCEARLLESVADVQAAQTAVDDAQAALSKAKAVMREVDALLTAEAASCADRDTLAAADLLAAVREGRKPKVTQSGRGHLDALTSARAGAEADVAQAQATLDDALSVHADCRHALLVARSSKTARDLHLSAHGYVSALTAHEDACAACRAYFDSPDLEQMVIDLRRESVGDPGTESDLTRGAEAR